jgi:hypothetical protein
VPELLTISYYALVNIAVSSLGYYTIMAIKNLDRISFKKVDQMQTEVRIVKEVQKEYTQLLESLDEGIIVLQNEKINFQNQVFQSIFQIKAAE